MGGRERLIEKNERAFEKKCCVILLRTSKEKYVEWDMQDFLKQLDKRFLRSFGFKRSRSLFSHTHETLTYIIEFQNERNFQKFTINIGIYVEGYHELNTKNSRPNTVSPAHCPLNTRINRLMGEGTGWWPSRNINENTLYEIEDILTKYVLPLFDRCDTIDGLIEMMLNNKHLAFNEPLRLRSIAYLYHIRGNKPLALTYFRLARNEITPKEARVFFDEQLIDLGYRLQEMAVDRLISPDTSKNEKAL